MSNRQDGRLIVRPLGWWTVIPDTLMLPLMYMILGTFNDSPQQTHRWNNHHLTQEDLDRLPFQWDKAVYIGCYRKESTTLQSARSKLPAWLPSKLHGALLHITIFGGTKDYVVIEPLFGPEPGDWWHVGWRTSDRKVIGVSRIRLSGPVRLLTSGGAVRFFGVNSRGEQISVQEQEGGRGKIGEGPKERRKIPLL